MLWMWKNEYWVFFNYDEESPDLCGSVDWVPSHKAKGCQFLSRPGQVPGLQDWSPVRPHTRSSQSMFLSHTDVAFPLSLHFPLSKNKEIKSFKILWWQDKLSSTLLNKKLCLNTISCIAVKVQISKFLNKHLNWNIKDGIPCMVEMEETIHF